MRRRANGAEAPARDWDVIRPRPGRDKRARYQPVLGRRVRRSGAAWWLSGLTLNRWPRSGRAVAGSVSASNAGCCAIGFLIRATVRRGLRGAFGIATTSLDRPTLISI